MQRPTTPQLRSINLGRAQPLLAGGRKVLSGIGKRAVSGPVKVGRMGLEGDDVADLSVDTPGTLTAGETFTLLPGPRSLSIADAIYGKRAKHLR
jgi:hypothetical protein